MWPFNSKPDETKPSESQMNEAKPKSHGWIEISRYQGLVHVAIAAVSANLSYERRQQIIFGTAHGSFNDDPQVMAYISYVNTADSRTDSTSSTTTTVTIPYVGNTMTVVNEALSIEESVLK